MKGNRGSGPTSRCVIREAAREDAGATGEDWRITLAICASQKMDTWIRTALNYDTKE
jgi:hypothetical protein